MTTYWRYAAVVVLCVNAAAQVNTSILVGSSDPIRLPELTLSPETTELLLQGGVSVRWRGVNLPLTRVSGRYAFSPPSGLVTPGLFEYRFWNQVDQIPLAERGW